MSENTTPLVSIVIPVYNLATYIGKTLDSVLAQTYNNIDIVVVDDGSYDGTDKILAAFAHIDKRISVVTKKNQGVSAARKDGIIASGGDYIYFLDGDDYIEPGTIEIMVGQAIKDDADIVSSAMIRERKSYTSIIKQYTPPKVEGLGYMKILLTHKIFTSIAGKLYRRSLWDGLEFHQTLYLWEDYVMNMQIALKRPVVSFINDALYHYVQRASSANRTRDTFEYLLDFTSILKGIVTKDEEAMRECSEEIRLDRLHWYLIYIKKSRNRWIGDTEYSLKLYKDVVENEEYYRKALGPLSVFMIKSYKNNSNKVIINFIATSKRFKQSFRRRFKGKFR